MNSKDRKETEKKEKKQFVYCRSAVYTQNTIRTNTPNFTIQYNTHNRFLFFFFQYHTAAGAKTTESKRNKNNHNKLVEYRMEKQQT